MDSFDLDAFLAGAPPAVSTPTTTTTQQQQQQEQEQEQEQQNNNNNNNIFALDDFGFPGVTSTATTTATTTPTATSAINNNNDFGIITEEEEEEEEEEEDDDDDDDGDNDLRNELKAKIKKQQQQQQQQRFTVTGLQKKLNNFCLAAHAFGQVCSQRMQMETDCEVSNKAMWSFLKEQRPAQITCDQDGSVIKFNYEYTSAHVNEPQYQRFFLLLKDLQYFVPSIYLSLYYRQLITQHTFVDYFLSLLPVSSHSRNRRGHHCADGRSSGSNGQEEQQQEQEQEQEQLFSILKLLLTTLSM